jgi:hypothetical protein
MEFAIFVSKALLMGAEGTEVLDSLWNYVVVKFEIDAANFG